MAWNRNADSVAEDDGGEMVFVKPWEEQQAFEAFVDFVAEQELAGEGEVDEVRYAQTREQYPLPPSSPIPYLRTMAKHPQTQPDLTTHRKRQPTQRVLHALHPRPARDPLGAHRAPTSPRRHQSLDRELAIRDGAA